MLIWQSTELNSQYPGLDSQPEARARVTLFLHLVLVVSSLTFAYYITLTLKSLLSRNITLVRA